MFKVEVISRPDFAKIRKNVRFGIAVGLTRTAKDGQAKVIPAVEREFTVRGSWLKPSNKFGIRITAAKRDKLESAVHTKADWLVPHETGGEKTPLGGRFAVPTGNVRRNKRQIIPKSQRPRSLKNTFVIQTKKGPVLFQRLFANKAGRYTTRKLKTNRGSRIVALFGLEKSVSIKKRSTFFVPLQQVVGRNVADRVREGIEEALATMR